MRDRIGYWVKRRFLKWVIWYDFWTFVINEILILKVELIPLSGGISLTYAFGPICFSTSNGLTL